MNVAMHLPLILLKLEDCASNMATRSQLSAWMDVTLQKTQSLLLLQCHQLYEERIQAQYVPISLFFD